MGRKVLPRLLSKPNSRKHWPTQQPAKVDLAWKTAPVLKNSKPPNPNWEPAFKNLKKLWLRVKPRQPVLRRNRRRLKPPSRNGPPNPKNSKHKLRPPRRTRAPLQLRSSSPVPPLLTSRSLWMPPKRKTVHLLLKLKPLANNCLVVARAA